MRERNAVKVARSVLRGGIDSNVCPLPDYLFRNTGKRLCMGAIKRHSRDCEETLRNEGSTADRREGMCGSYPYVCDDSNKDECIGVYVISEREECTHVL